MKGKELIELIEDYELQDFDIIFRINDTEEGYNLRDFSIDRIPLDIGYSDKRALLTGDEEKY